MKIEKILPISHPPILTYVDYAYSLSIIRNYKKTDAWYYSNYIQLVYQKRKHVLQDILKFFLTDCHGKIWYPNLSWLLYQELQRSMFKSLNLDIIDLLICSINEDNYIQLNWDEFYVPNGLSENNRHFNHAILVYGYNMNKKIFYVAGFQKYMRYEYFQIGFHDLEQAFYSNINDSSMLSYHDTEICLMKYNQNFEYSFDLHTLLQQLNDLYLSNNSVFHYKTHFNIDYGNVDRYNQDQSQFTFGLDSYKRLQEYIELLPTDINKSHQPLHALWEHKKIMTDRIMYLKKNNYLPKNCSFDHSYSMIEEQSLQLRNLFLKYKLAKNDKLIKKMSNMLIEIHHQEKQVLSGIIKGLS